MQVALSSIPAISAEPPAPISSRTRWAGRVLTALPALALLFDAAGKLAQPAPVVEACARLGISPDAAFAIGLIEIACVALYVLPRTAVLGAVLLTGFLGGAVAIHLRIGDPLPSHTLFPIYVGAVCWVGVYLRDARVRAVAKALLGGQR